MVTAWLRISQAGRWAKGGVVGNPVLSPVNARVGVFTRIRWQPHGDRHGSAGLTKVGKRIAARSKLSEHEYPIVQLLTFVASRRPRQVSGDSMGREFGDDVHKQSAR